MESNKRQTLYSISITGADKGYHNEKADFFFKKIGMVDSFSLITGIVDTYFFFSEKSFSYLQKHVDNIFHDLGCGLANQTSFKDFIRTGKIKKQ